MIINLFHPLIIIPIFFFFIIFIRKKLRFLIQFISFIIPIFFFFIIFIRKKLIIHYFDMPIEKRHSVLTISVSFAKH